MCVLRQENMRIKPKIVKKWKILQKTAPFLIIGMAVITAGSFFCGRYFYTDIERGKKQLAAAFWNAGEEILWKQIFPLEVRENNEDGYANVTTFLLCPFSFTMLHLYIYSLLLVSTS